MPRCFIIMPPPALPPVTASRRGHLVAIEDVRIASATDALPAGFDVDFCLRVRNARGRLVDGEKVTRRLPLGTKRAEYVSAGNQLLLKFDAALVLEVG